MRFVLAIVCWLVLASSAVSASSMNVTAQMGKVVAEANASDGQGEYGHPSETILSTDFEHFDETASAYILVSDGYASATSSQQSSISEYSFFATGSFTMSAASSFEGPGYADAAADNHFRVYFTVSESVDYSMFGLAQKEDRADVSIELKEGGVGGATIQQFLLSEFGSQTELPYSVEGTLAPGSYQLFAWSNGACWYYDGVASCSASFDLSFILDGATDAPALPTSTRIAAAPNPFRESTRFRLPEGAESAVIFDAAGRRILELSDAFVWDGRDSRGRSVPSGVYFVRAEGIRSEVAKVVRLK